jgi:hypothetical protein
MENFHCNFHVQALTFSRFQNWNSMNKKTRQKPIAKKRGARRLRKPMSAHEIELQRLLEEAEADIAAGRVEDADEVIKRLRKKYNL